MPVVINSPMASSRRYGCRTVYGDTERSREGAGNASAGIGARQGGTGYAAGALRWFPEQGIGGAGECASLRPEGGSTCPGSATRLKGTPHTKPHKDKPRPFTVENRQRL